MSSTPHPLSQRDPEQDFATITELFALMIEAQEGQALTPDDAWISHAQILAQAVANTLLGVAHHLERACSGT
jgi:hypothetical protein